MASVDTPQASSVKKGKKTKTKRVAIRIDMTPMVDVAFLLLTFFMLTTVFRKPQTMEINLPPDEKAKVEVAESNLMTIRVAEDGIIWWNMGTEQLKKTTFNEVQALLQERYRSNPKLITLVKVDRKGKYSMMVNIMDDLNLANITRFTLAPMLPADLELIKKAEG